MADNQNTIRLFIEKALPVISGVSQKTGNAWRKQEYVGKTLDQYPKTVLFSLFGDAIDMIGIQQGLAYDVTIEIESRSFVDRNGNERWSTDVKCVNANPVESLMQPQQAAPMASPSGYPQQQFQQPMQQQYAQPQPQYVQQQMGFAPQQDQTNVPF